MGAQEPQARYVPLSFQDRSMHLARLYAGRQRTLPIPKMLLTGIHWPYTSGQKEP